MTFTVFCGEVRHVENAVGVLWFGPRPLLPRELSERKQRLTHREWPLESTVENNTPPTKNGALRRDRLARLRRIGLRPPHTR